MDRVLDSSLEVCTANMCLQACAFSPACCFTSDRESVLQNLRRMAHDIALLSTAVASAKADSAEKGT